jgi:hypothetical protein
MRALNPPLEPDATTTTTALTCFLKQASVRRKWAYGTTYLPQKKRFWGFSKGGRAYLKVFPAFPGRWATLFYLRADNRIDSGRTARGRRPKVNLAIG